MARRTKFEAEMTRNAILDAAERVFYKHGVACTSMEQIARAAHVTRGAIYWHFKDKIEVCDAMTARVFLPQEDMLKRLGESSSGRPLEELQAACIQALKLIATDKSRRRVVSILTFKCEYIDEMEEIMKRRHACKDEWLKLSTRAFARAQKMQLLAKGWTPKQAATNLQALMTGMIVNGLEGRKAFDLVKAAPACLAAFFRSVRA